MYCKYLQRGRLYLPISISADTNVICGYRVEGTLELTCRFCHGESARPKVDRAHLATLAGCVDQGQMHLSRPGRNVAQSKGNGSPAVAKGDSSQIHPSRWPIGTDIGRNLESENVGLQIEKVDPRHEVTGTDRRQGRVENRRLLR